MFDTPDMRRLRSQIATLEEHGYEFLRQIGQGGFADVHLVRSRKYNQQFAAKVTLINDEMLSKQSSEIQMLMKLSHPNIIGLYAYFHDAAYLYIILDYCPNGSLADLMLNGKMLSQSLIQQCFRDITQALDACHKIGIAHRDIKPANILINSRNRFVLADFGLGVQITPGEQLSSTAGSLVFSPPEYFRKDYHCPFQSDIWSLGMVLFYISSGTIPYVSRRPAPLAQEIMAGNITFNRPEFTGPLLKVLQRTLCVDPEARASAEELLKMDYLRASRLKMSLSTGISKIVPSSSDASLRIGRPAIVLKAPRLLAIARPRVRSVVMSSVLFQLAGKVDRDSG